MLLPAFINVNKGGIPALSSISVEVTDTNIVYHFNPHHEAGRPFRGLVVVRLEQDVPSSATDTLPVAFSSSPFKQVPLMKNDGTAVTAADVTTGIHVCWTDPNTLQLIA